MPGTSSFQLFIEPQHRKASTGPWIACAEHEAKRWAVRSRRRDGSRWIVMTYASYKSKKAAYEDLQQRMRRDEASRFSPKPALGARFPKAEGPAARPPLAVSLTEHQYLALMPKQC